MKKLMLSIAALGIAGMASAQVYFTDSKPETAIAPMSNVMSVTNEGIAVGYCVQGQPFYIWNPMENTYREIGGTAPGRGAGGAACFSESGLKVVAPMFCADIPTNNEWVHSTIKDMEGIQFHQLILVSGDRIFAYGSNADNTAGAILRSANSGISWKRVDQIQLTGADGNPEILPTPNCGITCFADINHRNLIAGTSNGMLLTNNGSSSVWMEANLSGVESETPVKRYIAINFTHELVNEYGAQAAVAGCIAAELEDGSVMLWYTDDKAATFQQSETKIVAMPVTISNNGTDLFMSTTDGKILVSNDGGKTWSDNFTLPEDSVVTRIVFADAENGVALAGNTIYFTADGGKTWIVQTAPNSTADWKDAAWNGTQMLIVGTDGSCYISNDLGQTYQKQNGLESQLEAAIYKPSEKVYNVLGENGEAFRMTSVDKIEGYTAGIYDVENDTWTALPSTGYIMDEIVSSPWGLSGDGQYAVGTIRDLDKTASKICAYAAIWEGMDKVTVLPNLFSADGKSCRANAVSYDGSIVAGWQDKFGPWFACLWQRGEDGNYSQKLLAATKDFDVDTFDFDDKEACFNTFAGPAQVITPDGKWVGGKYESLVVKGAWIWSEETGFKVLTGEDATAGTVTGLSNDGTLAVGWQDDSTHAWIWTEEDGLRTLNDYVANTIGFDLGEIELGAPYKMSPNGRYICGFAKLYDSTMGYVIDLQGKVNSIGAAEVEQVKASVYPNPVAEELHVDLPFNSNEVSSKVTLVDMQGRVVARLVNPAQSNVIDVRGLSQGVYVLNVEAGTAHKTFKVIVK